MDHLKHPGASGLAFLTELFNLSLGGINLPSIWKCSTIIPILKPGKPRTEGASYRPISLLCPAVKILERLLLPFLTESLDTRVSQHGFKPKHSCVSALLPLVSRVTEGFNMRKPPGRTVAVAVDIPKAFDSVSALQLQDGLRKRTSSGSQTASQVGVSPLWCERPQHNTMSPSSLEEWVAARTLCRDSRFTIHSKSRATSKDIFSLGRCRFTPDLHSLLLLAGDIETNPGPTRPLCPACGRRYAKTRGALQCCSCKQWLCLTTPCSGHTPSTQPPQPWLCLSCTYTNNNNVPSSLTQHTSASLGPPARGTPRPGPPARPPLLPSPPTLPLPPRPLLNSFGTSLTPTTIPSLFDYNSNLPSPVSAPISGSSCRACFNHPSIVSTPSNIQPAPPPSRQIALHDHSFRVPALASH